MDLRKTNRLRLALLAAAISIFCATIIGASPAAPPIKSGGKTGVFLVATRNLIDPLFRQSVILMLPNTEAPLVVGLIINKPTIVSVRRIFPKAPALQKQDDKAYFGGPVDYTDPSLLMRSSGPSDGATHLFKDVYFTIDPNSVGALLTAQRAPGDLHVFLGRAQWSADQLHAEMQEGSWYVVPAQADLVFSADPSGVWQLLVSQAEREEVLNDNGFVPLAPPLQKGLLYSWLPSP
jgi:putative transcriptional regulator